MVVVMVVVVAVVAVAVVRVCVCACVCVCQWSSRLNDQINAECRASCSLTQTSQTHFVQFSSDEQKSTNSPPFRAAGAEPDFHSDLSSHCDSVPHTKTTHHNRRSERPLATVLSAWIWLRRPTWTRVIDSELMPHAVSRCRELVM